MDCVVMLRHQDTVDDLIELRMVDFDVIMGMDWLYSWFSKLDCRIRTVRFEFQNEPVIEWKDDDVVPKGRFISYLEATKMINTGCIYHSVRVTDTDAEAPTLESVSIVNAFLGVFPYEIPGIPPDREIDFGIDVMPDTYPISISPYRMASAELKELKEQLRDLEGIKVDPQKIAVVKNWPRPTTPTEIHSFFDLLGYYRKFVEGFSTLASLLTKLTQRAVKFQWSDACERSFQELKS
ncbi:uncharacterized protein [Nicotiana tomentosiformis]|uniref:uncharacterized protein n=1 Tax=Nicotiana tomentosiformis TaxID=4098 RepID=UPI00388CE1F0